jgi:hypothetical protein
MAILCWAAKNSLRGTGPMIRSVVEGCRGSSRALVGAAQLVHMYSICLQIIVINQITRASHGMQGQYSRVPMPSFWFISSSINALKTCLG